MVEHTPVPKTWDCLICDKPWPCRKAREQLAAEMNSIQLAMFGWSCLEAVVRDIPTMPVAEMYDRFMAWTRPGAPAEGPALTPDQEHRVAERWWRQ